MFASETSSRRFQDMSSRRLQDRSSRHVFNTSWRSLQRNNISSSKTSWRRLQEVLKTNKCLLGGVRSWFIGLLYCILWPWSQESDKYIRKSFVFCFPAKYLILVRAFSEKKSNKPITKSWNFVRTLLGSFLLKILRETSLEITKSLMSSLSVFLSKPQQTVAFWQKLKWIRIFRRKLWLF